MSTQAQISANQANALFSTGPRTPEGKASSALNRFRHGLAGGFGVLSWESKEEFEALFNGLKDEHKPSTLTETMLVEKMAQAAWLSRRALLLQHTTFTYERPGCDEEKQLALYIRYQITNDRAFHKCLNELLKLRAEKRKQEIGFESQQQKRADQIRREAAETRKQELHKWSVSLAEAKLDRQLARNSKPAHSEPGALRRLIVAPNAA